MRPNEPVRDVVARLRRQKDRAPATLYVTTAKARLLGTVETAALLAMAEADELP